MTIYVSTKEEVEAISKENLGRIDSTLRGEKESLDETVKVNFEDFINVFFPDEKIDSTYRQVVQKAVERGMPVQVATHYHLDPRLKGTVKGKGDSLGVDNVYCDSPDSAGNIWVFKTGIFQSKKDGCIYVVSYPHFIGDLNRKSLMDQYEGFPQPVFAEGIKRGNINHYLELAKKDVLEKLGMEGGFCYACLSDVLVAETNIDVQIIMDGDTIKYHRNQPDYKADMPINLSRNLGPQQSVSIQINYEILYKLLGEVFSNKVMVARIDGK